MTDFLLLVGLADDERRAVLAAATRRRFRRGETVFHEGDPGDTFHHVASGRVAVRVTTPTGEVATLAILGPGDGFGEGALLEPDSRRTAAIVAVETTETLALSRGDFEELRRRHPTVNDLLLDHLGRQVRRLSRHVSEALYLPAEKRVLRRLVELDDVFQGETIPLTQEDLATMAGTTRPTANRVLQQAADDGVVELGRAKLVVLDRDQLLRRAR
jgi:CRP-like cAMP-binding protein